MCRLYISLCVLCVAFLRPLRLKKTLKFWGKKLQSYVSVITTHVNQGREKKIGIKIRTTQRALNKAVSWSIYALKLTLSSLFTIHFQKLTAF
jgi:hypothetical protein